MNVSWTPVVYADIAGSILMLLFSCWCAIHSWQLAKKRPDADFYNYLFLFTMAIVFFAISRSFGHLIKYVLILNDLELVWQRIAPFSGAVNSTAFVVIFAFGISFHRFQKVHMEIENYRDNLEKMIATRTDELEKANNTLENILNNSNPINITGINFELLQANEAYYSIWPRAGEDSEAVKCFESRPGIYCHTDACPLKLIVEGHEEVVQEVSKHIQGETRDFITTARPFRDVDGQLIGMVESFQDITLRKQAEKVLIEMDNIKSEFISTAAHELNTPLSSMLGYTEFLLTPEKFGGFTDEQKAEFIEEVHVNAEALSRLVADLLDISRIEKGKPIPMALQEEDFVAVLRKKVRSFSLLHSGRSFRLDLPSDISQPFLVIDRHRINQALENLLNNAVRYSPEEKEIVITGRENMTGWEIRIADQGVGMNAEQLERIFEKFYRGDASNTATEGLGLGMSIVKQSIEAHGGEIRVESAEGKGTTVILNLPYPST